MSSDEIRNRTVYILCRTYGGNDAYVGSTSQPLPKRFAEHKYNAGNPSRLKYFGSSKLYQKMREVGVHNFKIVSLLTFACNRDTIFGFEKQWVEATGANLNTNSPVNGDLVIKGYDRERKKHNKEVKRYYCDVCRIACSDSHKLKRHFDTLKHSYAWLNSLD